MRKAKVGPYPNGLAGRHLVRWGIKTPNGTRKATRAELRKSIGVMKRMFVPPSPEPVSEPVAVEPGSAPAPAISAGSGGYAIPESIVQCESGGDYGAVNPSSGARGAYQIMPSTHAAHGCTGWSPAEQDECAARIWESLGSSAWVC